MSDERPLRLFGKRALVTGGSRGIGAAIARSFAREGAAVAVGHLHDGDRAAALIREIDGLGRRTMAVECDVADEEGVGLMVQAVTASLGGIDIVVNCAGITGDVAFEEMTPDVWDRMMNVNLRGAYLVTRAAYPQMRDRGWGRIVNIASAGFYSGSVNHTHYCAAKGGLIGFTRALALEAAPHGVLVNAIAPGPVETALLATLSEEWRAGKMTRMAIGRFGTPEEIAPAAVMLASEEGSFFVGQCLSPNGGTVFL
ncbi:MAG: 3-oxoacyl-ACP reductase family protein [Acetobacterales bacterium]